MTPIIAGVCVASTSTARWHASGTVPAPSRATVTSRATRSRGTINGNSTAAVPPLARGDGRRRSGNGQAGSEADGDLQPLRAAVRDERGLAGVVVVREAVRQAVDRVVVPELGVVVRRRGLVVQAGRRPLRL